jgi:hypothetical protein
LSGTQHSFLDTAQGKGFARKNQSAQDPVQHLHDGMMTAPPELARVFSLDCDADAVEHGDAKPENDRLRLHFAQSAQPAASKVFKRADSSPKS